MQKVQDQTKPTEAYPKLEEVAINDALPPKAARHDVKLNSFWGQIPDLGLGYFGNYGCPRTVLLHLLCRTVRFYVLGMKCDTLTWLYAPA